MAIEAAGIKHGGGAHVLTRLLGALDEDERVGRVTCFVSAASSRRFKLSEDARHVVIEPPHLERPGWRVLWLEAGLAQRCGELKPDVICCLNGIGYVSGVAQVNVIQQPLLFMPQVCREMTPAKRARLAVIARLTRASCQRASRVIVQTPHIASLASAAFALPLSSLSVYTPDVRWQEPAEVTERTLAMRAAPAHRRLLYLGSDLRYKNLRLLTRCVARLRATHYPNLKLFATIPLDHPLARRNDAIEALGALSRGEVRACLQLATALVMPSLAETVGLPMIEAMSSGCPVVASDLPYAHDVCQGAASLFDPTSSRSLAHALSRLLDHPSARQELSKRGRERAEALCRARPYARMVDVLVEAAAAHRALEREALDGGLASRRDLYG